MAQRNQLPGPVSIKRDKRSRQLANRKKAAAADMAASQQMVDRIRQLGGGNYAPQKGLNAVELAGDPAKWNLPLRPIGVAPASQNLPLRPIGVASPWDQDFDDQLLDIIRAPLSQKHQGQLQLPLVPRTAPASLDDNFAAAIPLPFGPGGPGGLRHLEKMEVRPPQSRTPEQPGIVPEVVPPGGSVVPGSPPSPRAQVPYESPAGAVNPLEARRVPRAPASDYSRFGDEDAPIDPVTGYREGFLGPTRRQFVDAELPKLPYDTDIAGNVTADRRPRVNTWAEYLELEEARRSGATDPVESARADAEQPTGGAGAPAGTTAYRPRRPVPPTPGTADHRNPQQGGNVPPAGQTPTTYTPPAVPQRQYDAYGNVVGVDQPRDWDALAERSFQPMSSSNLSEDAKYRAEVGLEALQQQNQNIDRNMFGNRLSRPRNAGGRSTMMPMSPGGGGSLQTEGFETWQPTARDPAEHGTHLNRAIDAALQRGMGFTPDTRPDELPAEAQMRMEREGTLSGKLKGSGEVDMLERNRIVNYLVKNPNATAEDLQKRFGGGLTVDTSDVGLERLQAAADARRARKVKRGIADANVVAGAMDERKARKQRLGIAPDSEEMMLAKMMGPDNVAKIRMAEAQNAGLAGLRGMQAQQIAQQMQNAPRDQQMAIMYSLLNSPNVDAQAMGMEMARQFGQGGLPGGGGGAGGGVAGTTFAQFTSDNDVITGDPVDDLLNSTKFKSLSPSAMRRLLKGMRERGEITWVEEKKVMDGMRLSPGTFWRDEVDQWFEGDRKVPGVPNIVVEMLPQILGFSGWKGNNNRRRPGYNQNPEPAMF